MVWVLIFDDLFDELSSFEYCMWSVLSENNPVEAQYDQGEI